MRLGPLPVTVTWIALPCTTREELPHPTPNEGVGSSFIWDGDGPGLAALAR